MNASVLRCCRAVLVLALAGPGCFSESSVDAQEEGNDSEGTMTSSATETSLGATSTGDGESTLGDTGETLVVDSSGTSGATDEGSSGGSSSSDGIDASSSSSDASSTGELILGVDALVPGDLVITEVMWNPNCAGDSCEWIEILNTTASTVDLLDLFVRDIDDSPINQGRITTNLLVEPGGLALIARGIGDWPYDVDAGGVYGPNPGINNSEPDLVSISNATNLLDDIPSVPFDQPQGIAWSLSGDVLDAVSNDNALNWCLASVQLEADGLEELGTPLTTNPAC